MPSVSVNDPQIATFWGLCKEPHHGTTVKLYMPRSEEDVAKEGPKDDTREFAQGTERILLVEDDKDVREVSVKILRKQGYEVVEAGDGKEAIQHLQDGQTFDLLFTDVVLTAGLSGFEIADGIKRIQSDIKVLYTSGYAESAIVPQEQLNSNITLLNKPYRREELLEKVRATLDSTLGEGTTVEMSLPRMLATSDDASRHSDPEQVEIGHIICFRVLLVEDDSSVCSILRRILNKLGHDVVEVASAEAAFEILDAEEGFDILLTDIGLPGMKGDVLAVQSKASFKFGVLCMSGNSSEENRERIKAAELGFLQKPFGQEKLAAALLALG